MLKLLFLFLLHCSHLLIEKEVYGLPDLFLKYGLLSLKLFIELQSVGLVCLPDLHVSHYVCRTLLYLRGCGTVPFGLSSLFLVKVLQLTLFSLPLLEFSLGFEVEGLLDVAKDFRFL